MRIFGEFPIDFNNDGFIDDKTVAFVLICEKDTDHHNLVDSQSSPCKQAPRETLHGKYL